MLKKVLKKVLKKALKKVLKVWDSLMTKVELKRKAIKTTVAPIQQQYTAIDDNRQQ